MITIAHGGCTNTAGESALKVDRLWEKIPMPHVSSAPGFRFDALPLLKLCFPCDFFLV